MAKGLSGLSVPVRGDPLLVLHPLPGGTSATCTDHERAAS